MADVDFNFTMRGPLFEKNVTDEVRHAIVGEVLDKVDQRVMRKARSPKLGRKNNTLSSKRMEQRKGEQSLQVDSTLNYPRTRGTAWVKYNVAMVRKLAPNVIRAAGRRLAQQLGGQ
jgi:hypothetical protein